jgi:hypothetical protein
MAAILKFSNATKMVNDNYPLRSGHKITTIDQVSLRLNKNASLRGGVWLNGRHFKMASLRIDFFIIKILNLIHCITVPIFIQIAIGVAEI